MSPAKSTLWFDRARRSPAIVSKCIRSVSLLFRDDDFLLCAYLSEGRVGANWGDKLNPVLVSMISGRPVLNAHRFFNPFNMPIYSVIGSGLGQAHAPNRIVWGQGFAWYDERLRVAPRQVCAVRGPLSRQKLLDAGVWCPAIFGDPALLLPRYFDESVEQRYRIGLIPHYSHLGLVEFKRLREQGGKIIDITADLFDVVRAVKSCDMIASSSLHGLIVADAYGVPSKWLEIQGHPIADEFRFHDYFRAVGRTDLRAFVVDDKSSLSAIEASLASYKVEIDLDRLYESCPFKQGNGSGRATEPAVSPSRVSPCAVQSVEAGRGHA